VIGAAAALTAGIAALVSAIAPGHTLGATTRARGAVTSAPTRPTSVAGSTRMPPLESASQLGLVAGDAPQAAPAQPQTQSSAPPVQQASPPVQQASPPVQQASPPVQQVAPPVAVSGGS
jgi:hypothetical protein